MSELTGRRRYRKTPHGLVLQVEYDEWLEAYKHWACFWRNATPEDLGIGEVVVDLPDQGS